MTDSQMAIWVRILEIMAQVTVILGIISILIAVAWIVHTLITIVRAVVISRIVIRRMV